MSHVNLVKEIQLDYNRIFKIKYRNDAKKLNPLHYTPLEIISTFENEVWSNGKANESPNKTHSSVLAWRIPGTGEPGRLPPMASHRVKHD